MLRNLSTSLLEKERITTTLTRAKELRPFAEKLVTLSKKETLHARRQALAQIRDKRVVSKLFDTLSARYSGRPGGYTRIIKLGPRIGDNAEMAIIELVGAEPVAAAETASSPQVKPARGRRRREATPAAAPEAETPKKRAPKRRAPAKGAAREAAGGGRTGASASKKKAGTAGRKGASKQKG
jgi:large subunit ribosomal protein L17